jgi:predicted ATP-grasp superfamily ATP-dependent carboligase
VDILDKGIWEQNAAAFGLDVPRRVEAGEDRFPVIVKELLHGGPSGGHTRSEAVVATNHDELDMALAEIRSNGGTGIAQQRVVGTLIGVIVIVDRAGNVVGRGQQEASRLWPAEAGVSTYARTVEPETDLVDKLGALVHELGWWGPAEAQFIETDSQKVLIDINPRIYGSIALATQAGLDVASMWAQLCRGETPTPARAVSGHRYQWLEGDLRRALFASDNGRLRAVGRTVAASLGAHHSLWSIRDPWPATRFAATLTGRALRKGDAWS